MKRLFYFVMMGVVTFPACRDEHDDGNFDTPEYVFTVPSEYARIVVPALGGTYTIGVTSTRNTTRIGYLVVDCPDWTAVTLDMTGLSVAVSEYLGRDENRSGEIILRQEESDKQLVIALDQSLVVDAVTLPAEVQTARLQAVRIEPQITGYNVQPQFRWTCPDVRGADSLLGTARDLVFIPRQAKEYVLSLTVRDGNVTETQRVTVRAAAETEPYSPMIARVFEYRPAPGWRVGSNPDGTSADTPEAMAEKCLAIFRDNGSTGGAFISLGDWGGYLVFGFDHTVINEPRLRDFRITSSTVKGNNTRPGVILVSFDANGNGLPDDEWYEIAGSEHMHVQTWRDASITYYNPYFADPNASYDPDDDYLKWEDSRGGTGYILCKQMPNANAQFPMWYHDRGEADEKVVFSGLTRLRSTIVMNGQFPDQYNDANYAPFAYGYACNLPDADEKGTSIDIDWAVDGATGRYANLPGIHFVKVYTGTFCDRGAYYGEADTDVKQAYDLHLLGKTIASE